jgi:hypothetical protein
MASNSYGRWVLCEPSNNPSPPPPAFPSPPPSFTPPTVAGAEQWTYLPAPAHVPVQPSPFPPHYELWQQPYDPNSTTYSSSNQNWTPYTRGGAGRNRGRATGTIRQQHHHQDSSYGPIQHQRGQDFPRSRGGWFGGRGRGRGRGHGQGFGREEICVQQQQQRISQPQRYEVKQLFQENGIFHQDNMPLVLIPNSAAKQLCVNTAFGRPCNRGRACFYSHAPKSDRPCKLWHGRGRCSRGSPALWVTKKQRGFGGDASQSHGKERPSAIQWR